MGKKILPALLFLLVCCLSGCNLGDLQDIAIVANVEDEFNLDLWESLAPDGRTLEFHISTIKEEDCSNAFIDHRLSNSTNGFSISLLDILKPADCDPEPAPAQARINLGALKAGFSNFSIDLKNTVFNEGQLTTLNDRYLIKMETEDGVKLIRTELLRVPEQSIWGYAHYERAEQEAEASRFLADLQAAGKPALYQPGYYGHFSIDADRKIEAVYDQPVEGETKLFLFNYSGDSASLEALLDKYRNAQNADMIFRLYDDKGNIF